MRGKPPTLTDCPPGFSRCVWRRLLPDQRRAELARYWHSLTAEQRHMLNKKYGVL